MGVGALGSVAAAAALVASVPCRHCQRRPDARPAHRARGSRRGAPGRSGVALVAALSLDFFHTQPYNSLKITATSDIETTVLMIVVGLAVGEIALRSEHIRSHFHDERTELRQIHHVAQLAAAGDSEDDVARRPSWPS